MFPGIVLAELASEGKLSKTSKQRLDKGIQLFQQKKIDKIILSGGVKKRQGYEKIIGSYESFAEIMQEYVLKKNVKKEDILLEDLSEDTVGQILFLKEAIFKPKKIKKGLFITHDYHENKLTKIVEAILGKENKFEYFFIPSNEKQNMLITEDNVFQKTFEDVDFTKSEKVLEILFSKHPFYNHNPNFYRKELKLMKLKKRGK